MIKVENVVKVFNAHSRNRNQVLKGVSFELPNKGLVAIYGKSGSGKTTLLNIIGGLDKQDSGKIYIDGENVSGKVDKIRNEKIGFIFQNYYLERGTITEIMRNAMLIAGFKDEEEIRQRTMRALSLVDMERYKNKSGDALSGGQKQRVAIARALVKGADIILADEPTGNLDAENTMKVMDILKEISKTKLVVIVTHEISLIKKYADSHIKLVDGQLVEDSELSENDLAVQTYGNLDEKPNEIQNVVFAKSNAKHNGKLFALKNLFKILRSDGEEKIYSGSNIVKKIFVLVIAVVLCFFAFFAFEAMNMVIENKTLKKDSVYIGLNSYTELRRLDTSLYNEIDIFDMYYNEGSFSYRNLQSLSGIVENYSLKTIPYEIDEAQIEYGKMPEKSEVLITRELAERIKNDIRVEQIENDRSLMLMYFNEDYRISGIVKGDEPFVYMNKEDYINFLGVYDSIYMSDRSNVLFAPDFIKEDGTTTIGFSAEISVNDGTYSIGDNQVVIEISRNALYKMMTDTTQADYLVQLANAKLFDATTSVYLLDSYPLYVSQFKITRDVMATDIRIHVTQKVLDNVFVYLAPNLDSFANSSDFYFEVSTSGGEQLANLNQRFDERGVASINIQALYDKTNSDIIGTAVNKLGIFIVIAILMYLIYYFIEKSGSVKNSKEYGIYRAIGVNKSNLLFKEATAAIFNNILSYLIGFLIVSILICIRYGMMNVQFGAFVALAFGVFAIGAVLMVCVSLIPYLFVLYQTPAKILSKYDI